MLVKNEFQSIKSTEIWERNDGIWRELGLSELERIGLFVCGRQEKSEPEDKENSVPFMS